MQTKNNLASWPRPLAQPGLQIGVLSCVRAAFCHEKFTSALPIIVIGTAPGWVFSTNFQAAHDQSAFHPREVLVAHPTLFRASFPTSQNSWPLVLNQALLVC